MEQMFLNTRVITIITMALTQIDFDEEEERIIEAYSKVLKMNKRNTIKSIIKDFGNSSDILQEVML